MMKAKFRRNQRRRVMQEIADGLSRERERRAEVIHLQTMRRMDQERIALQGQQLKEMFGWLDEVVVIVGRECILNKVPTGLPNAFDGMRVYVPGNASTTRVCNEFAVVATEVVRVLSVEKICDPIRARMHFSAQMADKTVAYALSESVIRHTSTDVLIRKIVPALAAQLVMEIKGAHR